MRRLSLPSGRTIPAFGLGTWRMGEDPAARAAEADALRLSLDLGMPLIDTAEMYGEGEAERIVGEVLAGRRDRVFLVSKVYPHHGGRAQAVAACERSLRRLGTDHLDLYLLHWRGSVPLAETLEAFEALRRDGKILDHGVSNFDPADLDEAAALPGGRHVATDQVLYNLSRRGIEHDLLPWCRARGLPVMAYSPLGQGRLLRHPVLKAVAERRGATTAQVALAWLLDQDGVVVIPKATDLEHVRENVAAVDLRLGGQDRADLERAFPPPTGPVPLAIL
ncbi:MAG: aldo/keto reductase [Candidatus Polarisedimenticolia bacterium]